MSSCKIIRCQKWSCAFSTLLYWNQGPIVGEWVWILIGKSAKVIAVKGMLYVPCSLFIFQEPQLKSSYSLFTNNRSFQTACDWSVNFKVNCLKQLLQWGNEQSILKFVSIVRLNHIFVYFPVFYIVCKWYTECKLSGQSVHWPNVRWMSNVY